MSLNIKIKQLTGEVFDVKVDPNVRFNTFLCIVFYQTIQINTRKNDRLNSFLN